MYSIFLGVHSSQHLDASGHLIILCAPQATVDDHFKTSDLLKSKDNCIVNSVLKNSWLQHAVNVQAKLRY